MVHAYTGLLLAFFGCTLIRYGVISGERNRVDEYIGIINSF
jgi:hypothetical protein